MVVAALEAAAADTNTVYVSFDIDAVDPSVAPGTGTPEPGGLSVDQALATMDVSGGHDAVGPVVSQAQSFLFCRRFSHLK